MKKHLLLAICFFTALQFGFSQENRSTKGSGKNHQVPTSSSRKGITPNPLAAFWTDDFSNTTNWTISNQVGNNDDWVIGTGVPAGADGSLAKVEKRFNKSSRPPRSSPLAGSSRRRSSGSAINARDI